MENFILIRLFKFAPWVSYVDWLATETFQETQQELFWSFEPSASTSLRCETFGEQTNHQTKNYNLPPRNKGWNSQDFSVFIILAGMEEHDPELVCGTHALRKCQWVRANMLQSLRPWLDTFEKIIENMCRGVLQETPPLDLNVHLIL